MATEQALDIRLERHLPVSVVALDGQLTQSVARGLREALLECLRDLPDALIVDLRRVSGIDDAALAVFPAVRQLASVWPAVPVLLCSASPAVHAHLARTGLARLVPVHPTQAAALAAASATASIARADYELLPSVHAPAEARRQAASFCRAWALPEIAASAELIVSELVTNAVTYTGGALRLTAVLRRTQLHLIVRDHSPDPPRPREAPAGDRHGHGLRLVEELADAWGYLASGTGKVVWALLRVTQASRRGPPRPPGCARG